MDLFCLPCMRVFYVSTGRARFLDTQTGLSNIFAFETGLLKRQAVLQTLIIPYRKSLSPPQTFEF